MYGYTITWRERGEKILQRAIQGREHGFKANLVVACSTYSDAMTVLTTHCAITDEKMDNFQDLVDNTFLDVSNSQNIITPLKLWPNDNIGDITFTIADDTSPTTTIQPQQTPLQHELSKTIQKTKASQLFENLTASGFNGFTEICPTKTVNHGNMTSNLSKVYNPSTVDSKKTSDVRHPSSMENGFCTKDVTEIGSSTATIPSSNKRFDKPDTLVTTNKATSNVTTGYVPSSPDNLTKRSVHAERVLADGKDDTVQDVLATTTISTTSIENGFAIKGGKEAATTTKKDKTVARPKTTNDQSTSKDPYFTIKGDGKMKGKDEIFLIPTSTFVSSPTKQVYIEVFNKHDLTLSPCSQLVELEVNQMYQLDVTFLILALLHPLPQRICMQAISEVTNSTA
jgi:hypothetical protein